VSQRWHDGIRRSWPEQRIRKSFVEPARTRFEQHAPTTSAPRDAGHYILHAAEDPDEVVSRDGSTGVVYVSGTTSYLDDLDDALSNLHMVIASEEVFTRAIRVGRVIQWIAASRREQGRGNVPDELIIAAKTAEWDFANAARIEVGLPSLSKERVAAFDFREDPEFQQRVRRRGV
jgi:hypothetical protein